MTKTQATNAYEIHWSNGGTEGSYETIRACLDRIEERCPDYYTGHDGDLSEGGDRTLVWARESDSENDDGANAVASIEVVV